MEAPPGDESAVRSERQGVAVRGARVDGVAHSDVLRAVTAPRIAWAEGETRIAGGGAAETVVAGGSGRFDAVRTRAEDLLGPVTRPDHLPAAARPRLYGGLAFHEDHSDADGPWTGFPGAMFVLPAVQVVTTDEGTWLTTAASGRDADRVAQERLDTWRAKLDGLDADPYTPVPHIRSREVTPDKAGWDAQVRAAVQSVRRGDLRKVVLAQALALDLDGDLAVPDILARLGHTYPDCVRFMVEPPGGGTFFGATPERLVSLSGRTVHTAALAGSTGRGETPAEDEWLAEDLQDSEKDAHEHDLVVEAIHDQLEPLADSVRTGQRRVRQLATVQHLETPIEATLDADRHVLSLVEALHPTPAVGGLPPDAAMETIRTTEAFERGWYAAPVGWIDGNGDGTFAVAIRSAVARDGTATLFAGDGIVADSDPDREWDELQLKYRPILDELA
jgi:menaquinone-specific isochorismate synthase